MRPAGLAPLLLAALGASCASTGKGHDYDPLEGMNRKIHWRGS